MIWSYSLAFCLSWVGGVDAVDLGGLHEHVGVDLGGAEGGAGVGGEEGVAGAGGEDDDAAFFQVADGAAADEGLGDAVDADGGHARAWAGRIVSIVSWKREGVDDGGEHAHVVGGGARDVAGVGEGFAADEVAAADDDGELTPVLATSTICWPMPVSSAASMPKPPSWQRPSPEILRRMRLYLGSGMGLDPGLKARSLASYGECGGLARGEGKDDKVKGVTR